MARTFQDIYFLIQRLRGGVDPKLVRAARSMLERPYGEILEYVGRRIEDLHTPPVEAHNWLRQQPLMDREMLRKRVLESPASRPPRVERKRTSGSTGSPVVLFKDMEMARWIDATMWAVYSWHGVAPGDPHARFWGAPAELVPRLRRTAMDWCLNRRRFNAFELSAGRSTRFFKRLRRLRPRYIHGYPTLLKAFVMDCREAGFHGADLGVHVVFSTGELLLPSVRAMLGGFFDCPVVNEYGCSESGLLGFECERGVLHQLPVAAFPEVVSADGEPVATGETGEVVATDLYGRVIPLVRYRLFDRGSVPQGSPCSCGRDLPCLTITDGRVDSFIQTPDRGPVYDAVIAYAMPSTVNRFRAYQIAPNRLLVELIPGDDFQPARDVGSLYEALQHRLGPTMRIEIRQVDQLAFDNSSKLRYFVPLEQNRVGRGA
jgi:phenylacetate-CoA ligase